MYKICQASNFLWKPNSLCCQNSYLVISFTSPNNLYVLMNGKMKQLDSFLRAMYFYSPLPCSSSLLSIFTSLVYVAETSSSQFVLNFPALILKVI